MRCQSKTTQLKFWTTDFGGHFILVHFSLLPWLPFASSPCVQKAALHTWAVVNTSFIYFCFGSEIWFCYKGTKPNKFHRPYRYDWKKKEKKKRPAEIFCSIYHPDWVRSCVNTTVSAAVLWPAVCISDIMKKTSMCGKASSTSQTSLFLLFTGKECFRAVLLYQYWQNNQMKPTHGNIGTFLTFSGQLASPVVCKLPLVYLRTS